MKCPKCDGTGKTEIGVGAFTIHGADCDQCNGKGIIEPMTNEEYLRSLNTEQLAEFLADELNDVVERVLEGVWLNDGDTDRDEYYQRQTDVLEWLKQPHSNE